MTENNDEIIINEYTRLSNLGKVTQDQLNRLKPAMIKIVKTKGDLDLPDHTIGLSTRKTWTYTEAVDALTTELKAAKTVEEASGAATYKETEVITCSRKKD
jgi:hypothetical protein